MLNLFQHLTNLAWLLYFGKTLAYYHPFLDESQKDIYEVQRKHTSATRCGNNITNMTCRVKNRIPITIAEWETYNKDMFSFDKKTLKRIESTIKDLNLTSKIKL